MSEKEVTKEQAHEVLFDAARWELSTKELEFLAKLSKGKMPDSRWERWMAKKHQQNPVAYHLGAGILMNKYSVEI